MKIKQIYEARVGSPFKKEDAQKIGEFIEKCEDKSTLGILNNIKKYPEHPIYKCIEWDDKQAADNYRLQNVRNIVNHLEIEVIQIGNNKPVKLDISIKAFESIKDENKQKYASISEGFSNENYLSQIMNQAKNEMNNWIKKYSQFEKLVKYVKKAEKVFA